MLPSALRTLSVVTMLGAVTGSVVLLNQPGGAAPAASSGSGSLGAAALIAKTSPLAAQHQEQRAVSTHRLAVERVAAAKARAQAAARAAAQVKAAAQRRQAARKAAASRSALTDPKRIARILAAERGWGAGQFSCLVSLWNKESRWNYRAANPSSGAYGIPQALPGGKMASAGSDWRTNPATQIRWGLKYIDQRYGTPCGAWAHSQSSNWY